MLKHTKIYYSFNKTTHPPSPLLNNWQGSARMAVKAKGLKLTLKVNAATTHHPPKV